MMTTNNITMAFPTNTITSIAGSHSRPLYATPLRITHTELNGNAASIHSNLGNGLHGHLALTIPTVEYLTLINNVSFVPPANPPAQPVHPAGSTGNQITEINRQQPKTSATPDNPATNVQMATTKLQPPVTRKGVPHASVEHITHRSDGPL